MRKRIWLPVALVGFFGVLAWVSVKPLARRVLEKEAARRGLFVEAGALSLSWGGVELRDVKVRLEGVEGVELELERVEARFSLSVPRLRAVEVEGGTARLRGSVDELKQRLADFRARQKREGTSEGAATPSVRYDQLRGLDVIWEGAFGEGPSQKFSGVQFERGPGGQRLGVDLISLQKGGVSLAVAGTELEWGAGESSGELRAARASEMRVRFVAADEAKGDAASGQGDKDTPALLPPSDDPDAGDARGLLDRFGVERARVARLSTLLTALRTQLAPRLPDEAEVAALTVAIEKGAERLQIGPQRLGIQKSASEVNFKLSPGALARGTPLALSGRLPRGEGAPVQLKLEGGPIALRALGVREGDWGLRGVGESTISGSVRVNLSPDNEMLTVEGQATLESLELTSGQLSPEPVFFPRLRLGGRAELSIDGSRYALREGELVLGEARFLGEFSVTRGEDFVVLAAQARAPLVSCQALVDSAPRGVLGAVGAIGFAGTFSLDASVEADTRKLGQMAVHFDFKNDCTIRHVPTTLDPSLFRGVFQKEVRGPGDVPMRMEFGPTSHNWTPYDQLPRFMEAALLVTEDGRFFKHDGFDDRAIESSIRDNTKAGRFVRGASTLSMQLAKNLYLSRDKNLSRKLQEVALTVLLEQSFDKRGLLELYLNVVEFGPGVYGVRSAATHYFNTAPQQLTASQCFFLASILPAPSRDYFGADGRLRPTRAAHVAQLLQIAKKRERLTEAELTAALSEKLVFGQASTADPGALPPEGGPPAREPGAEGGLHP